MIKRIHNFYDNPDEVRKEAIKAQYERISFGNYLGKDSCNKMINIPSVKLFDFPVKVQKSRFRYALEGDTYTSYVHTDGNKIGCGWHVIIPLTIGSELDGIDFYEHVKYGKTSENVKCKEEILRQTEDFTVFKKWHFESYEFNTAILLDYSYFHAPHVKTGFGDTIENSRLFHIIEYRPLNL